jgi:hypothetical protein
VDSTKKEAMDLPEFPEHGKRKRMLRYIHEWVAEQHTQGNYSPMLAFYNVNRWGEEQEGMNGPEAVSLFQRLVEDGYISLNYPLKASGELPWIVAALRGLTRRGLLQIGELPVDPDARLLGGLGALERAIRELDVPDEGKKYAAIEAAQELRNFVRTLPPETAVWLGRVAIAGVTGGEPRYSECWS